MSRCRHPRLNQIRVVVDDDAVAELRARLGRTRLAPALGTGWDRGAPRAWLEELLDDWRDFDVPGFQAQLDELPHFHTVLDGQLVHAVCVEGTGPRPVPLLLAHGWPGSFLEYLKLIPLLTAADETTGLSFTVIIPSLPGFGFSGPPPPEGLGARQTATLFHRLVHDEFGWDRYVAHGSDLGAGVVAWLARDHPAHVCAIHLATPGLSVPEQGRSEPERQFAHAVATWSAEEGGYLHEHATKPGTLAAALSDSPAGLAAWIGEKIVAWSSQRPDKTPSFDRELLLSTLTLYWTTNTIASSLLPYWAYRHGDGALPVDSPSPVPTAVTIFGGERVPFPKPPRELAERYYTVTAWREYATGGHFPAVAEPDTLAEVLRQAFSGRIAAHVGE